MVRYRTTSLWVVAIVAIALGVGAQESPVNPPLVVTKTEDTADGRCDRDCSLREAIIAANDREGFDEIIIPPHRDPYALTLAGEDDEAAVGDLDLRDRVSIRGGGAWSTIIEGDGAEPVFHMAATEPADRVTISQLTIRNGGIGKESLASAVAQTAPASRLDLDSVVLQGNHGAAIVVAAGRTFHCTRCTGYGNGTSIKVDGGDASLSDSTFSADASFGLEARRSGRLALEHVTIAGEVRIEGATSSWRGVILAGECDLADGGAISSSGGNVESPDATCGLHPETDMAGVSPGALRLGPLADNGGGTPTHAIAWNSAAVGLTAVSCGGSDQRQAERPQSGCAAGAYEPAPPFFRDGFETGILRRWSRIVR